MKNMTTLIGVLILLVFAVSAVSAANSVYLDPQDSNKGCGESATVQVRMNATDSIWVWQTDLSFDPSCVNITDVDFTGSPFMLSGWGHHTDYIDMGGTGTSGVTGDVLLATLTIEGTCDCNSALDFAGDEDAKYLSGMPTPKYPADWINGTFTCGTLTPLPCLGDCYEDLNCTYLLATNVTCYDCIGKIGQSWENYPCPVGTSGCTCPSKCWTECPECCDGIDNDGDGVADWPADPKCGCCIDGNETDGTVPCPPPCVPELPTLALAGIGILGIALLARKRD